MACQTCRQLARSMHRTLEASAVQGNSGFSVPGTANSGSGAGAEAFPDTTGETVGINASPEPRGDYGVSTNNPSTNPVQGVYGPNTTVGFVPPPKAARSFTYGIDMTAAGALKPNPYEGYLTIPPGGGALPGVRLPGPTYRPFTRSARTLRYTDDGGSVGGQGAGAASGGAFFPGKQQVDFTPQSNFNPYARKQHYGDGPGAYWSWNIANDAEQVQKAFGIPADQARPFTRVLHSDVTSGLEGAAIGGLIGTFLIAPFIWTALGRELAGRGIRKAQSSARAHLHKESH